MSWTGSITDAARDNADFRRVLSTGPHAQLVVMSIPAGGEIGEEVHDAVDQVISIVEGSGEAVLDDVPSQIGDGDLVLVPAGTKHNIRNVGTGDLKLYTVYAPPEHPDGTVHRTRAEADAAEH
ncbi:MAG TPA: cupin domain-containing protein [Patescibacteria group bacterium]|nr:cupin domain-containing protein [Patescibacteria group bacterium]